MKQEVAPESIMAFPEKGFGRKLDLIEGGVSRSCAANDAYI
jgi:hypothetical protein